MINKPRRRTGRRTNEPIARLMDVSGFKLKANMPRERNCKPAVNPPSVKIKRIEPNLGVRRCKARIKHAKIHRIPRKISTFSNS
jgi:hypothetical protein